ncbi:alpha/beta hydrolase family protein [Erythrobacter alti]|uniref:alpha/beta hydrolase family protein n=1 Tax=Erythrobacter alti TaxID=1896145 RepID=UPI0030F3E2A7
MGFFRFVFGAIAAAALWLVPASASLAQDAAPAVVTEVQASEIPDVIPTSAFASRSSFNSARLSPDGSRFAFTVLRDDQMYLSVFDSSTRELVGGIALGEPDDFKWFRWAGNERLLLSMLGRDSRYDLRFSRLVSFNLEARRLRPLVLNRMSFDGDNIIHTNHDAGFVLVAIAEGWGRPPDVWRFDLTSEEHDDEIRGVKVESRQNSVGSWLADETGVVRIGLGVRGYSRRLGMRYRSNAGDNWETVARVRLDDTDARDLWDFMGLRAGSDVGYSIAVPPGGERRALMEFDFSTGEPGRIVFQSADEDVSSVVFGPDRTPIAVGYAGENYRREWLDPQIRRWREQLGAALPGSDVTILDIDDSNTRMLVLQSGPADPGALYVFTPGERDLALFAEYRPGLQPEMLATPRAMRYEARDGTSIHGYLTLPRGRDAANLPLIVHPHGGPYGVRDWDDYNDMVQLLANRGYAVIQPNYRGSGGFGESFELLGHGQVGRVMQDDLDDVVAHLVAQGTVDPDRVCMIGSSYGGFAAVWGAIRNPEIYRCAVSFAGVMHFERQLAHDSDYLFGRNRGRHWDRIDGDQTNFDLDDVSPAVQVRRLTRPVLLVHGEKDNRVPFDQFELMVGRADNAGIELETLALEDSGHGFYNPEDEQAYYDAIVDFLARHNPAD